MSFADLIKKGSLRQVATVTVATAATVKPQTPSSVASVETVSVATARKQAANDPVQIEGLVATQATVQPPVMLDPDRWCWPHSQAMTGREIDTMAERTSLFNRRGLPALDAERLADKLVNRDRDGDDRHLCVECRHCRPGLRCVNKLAVLHVLQRCDHFVPIHLS